MHKVVFKLCLNLKASMIFHKDEKDMLLNKTSTLVSSKKCIALPPRHQKLLFILNQNYSDQMKNVSCN